MAGELIGSSMKNSKIESLRNRIDAIDDKVVDLIVKRYSLADEIGKTKDVDGSPVKDSDREAMVLKMVRRRAAKPLTKDAVENIYSAILKESRRLQSKKAKAKRK